MEFITRISSILLTGNPSSVASVFLLGVVACAALLAASLSCFYFGVKQHSPPKKLVEEKKTVKEATKKERPMMCPFSADTNFLVETAEHLAPTPLDMFEDWSAENSGMPLAARWLEAGLSGQESPGILRAGLKRLRNSKHFLVEDTLLIAHELQLKKQALDDPVKRDKLIVAEPDSVPAQQEVLDLFVSFLPVRYPDLYTFDKIANSIYVKPIDETFLLDDWKHAPLELCNRIVQEDFCLVRAADDTKENYVMAAAAVVFSFDNLQQKLGQPMEFLHAPIPGANKHLTKVINLTFAKIKSEQPVWRNNWGIAPTGNLVDAIYGAPDSQVNRSFADVTVEDIKAKFLRVEYETFRRLPKSEYVLFTIKTMSDPLYELEKLPTAAACLAKSIRGMSSRMRVYKGIEDDRTCDAVLSYLDSIK
jgi:hypothetical protein